MTLVVNGDHEGIPIHERRTFELICKCTVRAIGWEPLTAIDDTDIEEPTFRLPIDRINVKHTSVTLKKQSCIWLCIGNLSTVSH